MWTHPSYTFTYVGAGGGAPGGNGGRGGYFIGINTQGNLSSGIAGACIILIANILNCDKNAISTGGGRGETCYGSNKNKIGASGGGGTGFCYIAAKELI